MPRERTSIVKTNEAAALLPVARSFKALIEWMEEEEYHEITLPQLRKIHEEMTKQIGHVEER